MMDIRVGISDLFHSHTSPFLAEWIRKWFSCTVSWRAMLPLLSIAMRLHWDTLISDLAMSPSSISMENTKNASKEKLTMLDSEPSELVTEGEEYEALAATTRRSNAYSESTTVYSTYDNHAHVMTDTYRKVTMDCPHRVDHI
jgi:hypothetical protein